MFENRRVCVAIDLSEESATLARSALAVCRAVDAELRLVHVTEPWLGAISMGLLPMAEVNHSVQMEIVNRAKNHLEELAKGLEANVPITTQVYQGVVSDSIIADVVSHPADLIVCGSSAAKRRFTPRGFSTTNALMGNAPVPVLVIPNDADPLESKSVLACDDLSAAGFEVVRSAFEIARAARGRVQHCYVNGVARETMQSAIAMAAAAGRTTVDPSICVDEFVETLEQISSRRMQERASRFQAMKEFANVGYEALVLHGDPADEIVEFCNNNASVGLVVFGRHVTIHRKPFLVGRVPFRTMLAAKCSVMVVPPA